MIDQPANEIKVIAHRGLCNIFPENTLESLTSALYYCDFAEFDILLTKDQQIIVFHDRALSTITDVGEKPEFKQRKHTETIDNYHKAKDDWWVKDFTLEQLKSLRVKQREKNRPQLENLKFSIPTLEQLIIASLKVKEELKGSGSGLLMELKAERYEEFTEREKILCSKVDELLKKYQLDSPEKCKEKNLPIYIQSFELRMIQEIKSQNYQCQLFDKNIQITHELLTKQKSHKIKGIGITKQHVKRGSLKEICDKFNYQIFYWTLRDDQKDEEWKNYNELYCWLKDSGVTGMITEFPDKCHGALKLNFK